MFFANCELAYERANDLAMSFVAGLENRMSNQGSHHTLQDRVVSAIDRRIVAVLLCPNLGVFERFFCFCPVILPIGLGHGLDFNTCQKS